MREFNDNQELESYWNKISSRKVRDFVLRGFEATPAYFWTLMASTSGKYHGDETLVEHVCACCHIMSTNVFEQMYLSWTQRDRDIALAAMMLHDCWKCGYGPYVNKDRNGNLRTDPMHGFLGWNVLNGLIKVHDADLELIAEAVRYHYGPFDAAEPSYLLTLPITDIRLQVHLVDAHQTWSSMLNSKGPVPVYQSSSDSQARIQ